MSKHTSVLKNLLQTTLESYEQGLRKPIQITPGTFNRSFDEILDAVIERRLPLEEQLLLRKCSQARKQGLLAARNGHIITANQFFSEARAILCSDKLSNESKLICKSFLAAVEAYLDYRCGNFDQARTRLYEALAIDLILEEECDYKILHLHRIQLVHNFIRIEARCLRFKEAITLGSALLSYLEGNTVSLPIPGIWSVRHVAAIPLQNITAMFTQVTTEIAFILAGQERSVSRDLFAIAACHTTLPPISNCNRYPQAHSWFRLKEAFVNNSVEFFLEQLAQFLADGRGDMPELWYAAVVDLVSLCYDLHLPQVELIKWRIASDATTWEYLPHQLRSLLVS